MSEGSRPASGLGQEIVTRGRSIVAASAQIPLEALGFLGASHRRLRVGPPPGAAPGEFVVPPRAVATEIHAVSYGPDSLDERVLAGADELSALLPAPGRVVWIDVRGFGDRRVLERLGEILDIHPLAIADVVNVPQRPKVEPYGDRVLMVTHMARITEAGEIEMEQVSLVLGPGWIVTFHERPGDVFDPVRARIRSGGVRIRQGGADYLAYALLDAVIDGYFPVVEAIGEVLGALEEEVLTVPGPAVLARIHATRRMLLHLHRVQWRQRDALSALLRDEESPFSPPVRVYLRDAHDHAFQIVDAIETYRDLSVGLMDVYLSSASNRMNEVMKTLTVMASIFIPLTFVAGVYGMNFDRMPELHWRWGYPAAWGIMVTAAIGLAIWFRRRGWIGERSY